jgi:hypothetical protein
MDKGPNGTIEKFPARKNNDFMIKVLIKGIEKNLSPIFGVLPVWPV